MLIVSKFHDYYDAGASTGVDKTRVYNRLVDERADFTHPYLEPKFAGGWGEFLPCYGWRHDEVKWDKTMWEYQPFIVGFCGRLYLGYEFSQSLIGANPFPDRNPIYTYDIGAMREMFSVPADIMTSKKHGFFTGAYKYKYMIALHEHFAKNTYHDLFRQFGAPVFVYWIRRKYMLINGELKSVKFFKVKDTVTAFQDIYTYIGNILVTPDSVPVEISEKDKLVQHGMDPKWSFRNPDPPKRKMNKNK